MVTQDTSLLHRSIRENIRYGRPDATEAEIVSAAQLAHAEEFIATLEDWRKRRGYDAQVGERGVKLSGGQRQRIAIARVILKNAPILVLDEATSALDSEVEAAIQESLGTLMAGKTVIAIAHRLSTIARMDRLVVLDRGRIVEQGTHDQLLRHNGHYAALWRRQSGGFIDAGDSRRRRNRFGNFTIAVRQRSVSFDNHADLFSMSKIRHEIVDPKKFNSNIELPYSLRLKDFELAMQDVYDFFHDVNGLLLAKGLHRLDDMLRPAAMSGTDFRHDDGLDGSAFTRTRRKQAFQRSS